MNLVEIGFLKFCQLNMRGLTTNEILWTCIPHEILKQGKGDNP